MKLKRVLFVLMFGLIALLLVACGGKTVESIEVEGLTFPQLIKVGDPVTLDKTAVEIKVTYDDGSVETVNLDDVEISGAIADGNLVTLVTTEKGKKTISISYKGTSIDVDFMVYGALPGAVKPDSNPTPTKEGTEEFPYLIETVEHLVWLSIQVNGGNTFEDKYFQLQNDIDMEAILWIPIGELVQEVDEVKVKDGHVFKGSFDGNNKTIKNLMVNNPGSIMQGTNEFKALQGQGFFAALEGATIKNLTFDNAYVKGLESVAVLAARVDGETLIDGVHVVNSVITGAHWVGGLVGYKVGTLTIINSSVENSIIGAYVYGKDPNGDKVGGLVGQNANGVLNAYGNKVKDVELTGFRDLGGLVGFSQHEDDNITQNVIENVILRLDKAQLTNPNHRDGQKGDFRYVGAVVGGSRPPAVVVVKPNTVTNVRTYTRLESATQYVEQVTMNYGKVAQDDYNEK